VLVLHTRLCVVIGWLKRWVKSRRARGDYFAADRRLSRAWNLLESEPHPGRRALLLADMAVDEELRAEVYTAAFGADPNPDEGGRDMATSTASSAMLLHVLSNTEVLTPDADWDYTWADICEANDVDVPWVEAQPVLERLCHEADPAQRAVLVWDLCDAVVDRVGGQAAETLASIALSYQRLAGHMVIGGAA
jgi:hypothetical protein